MANQDRTAAQHVNPDQAAADARLNSMQPDYNAVVVATHDAQAGEAQKKIIKAREEQARAQAETDHINDATVKAHDANALIVKNRIEAHNLIAQREADAAATRLDSMQPDYNAVVVATHDNEAAIVTGKLKTAANVTRTAGQQVNPDQPAADARLNSMAVDPNAEVVAAHDAQAYSVAQGVARKADNANRAADQHVDGNVVAIADNTTDIAANTAGVAANRAGVAANKAGVEQTTAKLDSVTYDIAGNRRAISSLATRAADTDARIAETKAEQAKTNERVSANSAAIADHESRIESLESETTSKFSSLKNKVEENRKRASAGIAGVAAMANIPQVTDTQNFSVGAGVGNTDSESALAVGFSARATQNVVVKSSVSNDTQHNFVVGAGVSYGW